MAARGSKSQLNRGASWLLVVIVALALLAAGRALAQREEATTVTFTVNSTADAVDTNPGDGVCATTTGVCTLRAAVQESNALAGADNIALPAGTYLLTIVGIEDNAARGDLDITDDVTIIGAGQAATIIDGNGSVTGDRVFHIPLYASADLSGLTIQGGNVSSLGGGVYSRGTLTLAASMIRNNSADQGGGLANEGTLMVTATTISGNTSNYSGGGVRHQAGEMNMVDTLVSGNTTGSLGGGIFGFGSTATLTNTVMTNNTADQGGGLAWEGGTVSLNTSTISRNTATDAGGLYNRSSVVTLQSSTVEDNQATEGSGGGIFVEEWTVLPTVKVYESAILNNTAAADGGGIYNGNLYEGGVVEIRNSTFSGNTAGANGGGVHNYDGEVTLVNTTITGNAASEGGGFYRWDGPATIKSNLIAGNFDTVGHPDCRGSIVSSGYNLIGKMTCFITANEGDQFGSSGSPLDPLLGPLQDNGGPTLTHDLQVGSTAIDGGDPAGCTDLDGNPLTLDQRGYVRPVDGDLDSNAICDIGALEFGSAAGADFSLNAHPPTLALCAPADAVYETRVFSVLGFATPVTLSASGHPTGTQATFSLNPVTPGNLSLLTIGDTGSAPAGDYHITVTGAALTQTHSVSVELGLRSQLPAAPTLLTPANGAGNVTLKPDFAWTTVAQADSYTLEVATDPVFSQIAYSATLTQSQHTTITPLLPATLYYWRVQGDNVCGEGTYPATFTFTTQTRPPLTVNSPTDAQDADPGDGVCASAAGECTLRAAVMEANTVSGQDTIELPAGNYVLILAGSDEDAAATGDLDITDDLDIGGAGAEQSVVNGNGNDRVFHVLSGVTARIERLTVEQGQADNGGGLYNSGTLTLAYVTFFDNHSTHTGVGGGGAVYNNGTLTVRHSTFLSNTAADRGGGLYNDDGTATLTQVSLNGNTADYGGGAFNDSYLLTFLYSTFTGNVATNRAGAVYSEFGSVTLTGDTLVGNSATLDGGAIAAVNAPIYLTNSTLSGNSAGGSGGAIFTQDSAGAAILRNSTVTANTAEGAGGGLYNTNSTVLLQSSVVAGNVAPETSADCAGNVTSEGYNVVGTIGGCAITPQASDHVGDDLNPLDARLGPLQNNGGPTPTHALLTGSPAIDAGRAAGCRDYFFNLLTHDQRGYARTIDGDFDGTAVCDAGAYEYESVNQPDFTLNASPARLGVCLPAGATSTVTVASLLGYQNPVTLEASGLPPGASASFAPNPVTPTGDSTLTLANLSGPGGYPVTIEGISANRAHTLTLALRLYDQAPGQPVLLTPPNGAANRPLRPLFTWTAEQAGAYTIEIATDPAFTDIVDSAGGLRDGRYQPAVGLLNNQTYYWRVRALNACSPSIYSPVYTFTTWTGTFQVNVTTDAADANPGDGRCDSRASAGDSTPRCTLRAAIQEANAQNSTDLLTIELAAGNYVLTLPNDPFNDQATGDLDVTAHLHIQGLGDAAEATVIDGNNAVTGDRTLHLSETAVVTLEKLKVRGGRAVTGGGIYSSGVLTLTESTVTGNTSYGLFYAGGGGIFNEGPLWVERSKISSNHADDRGGAIYSQGAAASTTILDSDIRDNSSNYGGALFFDYSPFTIENTTLWHNTLGQTGGGLYLAGATGVIRNSLIANGLANDNGGGIASYGSNVVIENSTISGNTAVAQGGGLNVSGGDVLLVNSTVAFNVGNRGGGIYDLSAAVRLQNTIVAANTADRRGPDCRGEIVSEGYNLVQRLDDCTFSGDPTGNILGEDADLEALQDNGGPTWTHALFVESPAVDAGNPAGCTDDQGLTLLTDQRGFVRHVDGDDNGSALCDMGAYEFASAQAPGFTLAAAPPVQNICAPATAAYDLTLDAIVGYSNPVTLSAAGYPAGATATFSANPVTPPGSSTLTIGNTGAATAGTYPITVTGVGDQEVNAAPITQTTAVTLNLFTTVPAAPTLSEPPNNATYVSWEPLFVWSAATQGFTYTLEVATDPGFADIVYSAVVVGTSHTPATPLAPRAAHYWRARPFNSCGEGSTSAVFRFKTEPTDFTLAAAPAQQGICAPAAAGYDLTLGGESDPVTLSASGYPAGTTATFDPNPVLTPGNSVLTVGNTGAATNGGYDIAITGQAPFYSHTVTVHLDLFTATPGAPSLLTPANGAVSQPPQPTFTWTAASQSFTYTIETATDAAFTDIVDSASGLTTTSYTPSIFLDASTTYYWRVWATNSCGQGALSAVFTFTTWAAAFIVNSTADAIDADPGDGLCVASNSACTLRAAIMESNAIASDEPVVITLPAGLYNLALIGGGENEARTGDLDIQANVVLNGAGATATTLDAKGSLTLDRVFEVLAGARLTLNTMTVSGGQTGTGGGVYNSGVLTVTQAILRDNIGNALSSAGGGAIYSGSSGALTVQDSTFTGNIGSYGGTLYARSGTAVLERVTVTGNTGETTAGGFYNDEALLIVRDSTITGNTAYYAAATYVDDGDTVFINTTITGNTGSDGIVRVGDESTLTLRNTTVTANASTVASSGGVDRDGGTLLLVNSLVAGNTTAGGNPSDCEGTITSYGYNLLGINTGCNFQANAGDQIGTPDNPIDPLLGPLQDNGGPTLTHALLTGSPAVDAGNPAGCADDQGRPLVTDQRGYVRPIDGDKDGDAVCDPGAVEFDSTSEPGFRLTAAPSGQGICAAAEATFTITANPILGYDRPVTLSASGQPPGTTATFNVNPIIPVGSSDLTISNTAGVAAGSYPITINGIGEPVANHVSRFTLHAAPITDTAAVTLTVFTTAPATPLLLAPADGATGQPVRPIFVWTAATQGSTYELQIATDPGFSDVIYSAGGLTATTHIPTIGLDYDVTYYWRVRASNSCGTGDYSAVFTFTTTDGDFLINSTADGADLAPGDGQCLTAEGLCTLRAAIQEVNATTTGQTALLIVPAGLYTLTVPGADEDAAAKGDLDLVNNVILLGEAANTTIIEGNGAVTGDRVFHVLPGTAATMSGLTIRGGRAVNGGGLYNSGTLTITHSTLTANQSTGTLFAGGGAIFNNGTLTVKQSALYGNTSGDRGGAIYNTPAEANTRIVNSTLSGNTAGHGGALFNDNAALHVASTTIVGNSATKDGGGLYQVLYPAGDGSVTQNSIWANNTAGVDGPNCRGGLESLGYNLLENNQSCSYDEGVGDQVGTASNPIDPKVGPLQDNGGPTWTHALLSDSPALDAASPGGCHDADGNLLTTDQRGYNRHEDGDGNGSAACDIGAYEVQEEAASYCRVPNLAIPDNTPAGVTDTLTITDTGALADLNISLLVDHPYVGDLVFDLEHMETGTSVRLIERPGGPPAPYCDGNHIDATLDDEASGPVEDACAPSEPAIAGSFTPNNPLSTFDGQDLSGTWRLTARDVAVNGLGTLAQWCVKPEVAP